MRGGERRWQRRRRGAAAAMTILGTTTTARRAETRRCCRCCLRSAASCEGVCVLCCVRARRESKWWWWLLKLAPARREGNAFPRGGEAVLVVPCALWMCCAIRCERSDKGIRRTRPASKRRSRSAALRARRRFSRPKDAPRSPKTIKAHTLFHAHVNLPIFAPSARAPAHPIRRPPQLRARAQPTRERERERESANASPRSLCAREAFAHPLPTMQLFGSAMRGGIPAPQAKSARNGASIFFRTRERTREREERGGATLEGGGEGTPSSLSDRFGVANAAGPIRGSCETGRRRG